MRIHRLLVVAGVIAGLVGCMTERSFSKKLVKHECQLLESCWPDYSALYVSQTKCRDLRITSLYVQQFEFDLLCEYQPKRARECVTWMRRDATCGDVDEFGGIILGEECFGVYNCPDGLFTSGQTSDTAI